MTTGWFILAGGLPLAFLLSGLEGALLATSRVRARYYAEEGDKKAARLLLLLDKRLEVMHAVCSFGQICKWLVFAAVVALCVRALGSWGWLAAGCLAVPFLFFLIEFLPKLVFRRYPFKVCRFFTGFLSILHKLATPWLKLTTLIQRFGGAPAEPESHPQKLKALADSIQGMRLLPDEAMRLMRQVTAFQSLQAADILIPMRQLTALPPDMPLQNALLLGGGQKHAWRTVLAENGNLLGWLDLGHLPLKPRGDRLVRQFIRPIATLHHTESALRCLQALRKRGEPVAAVANSRGQTVGVITMESLLRHLLEDTRISGKSA